MENLTIADLYAVKSHAKEKEDHYRRTKMYVPEHVEYHTYWAAILAKANAELEKRIAALS